MIQDQTKIAHLVMFAFSVIVAGSFISGAIIANEVDPVALSTMRFFIAFWFLLLVLLFTKQNLQGIRVRPWRYLILGSLISLYFVLMLEGLKTASAVNMTAVMTLTPFIVVFLDFFLNKKLVTMTIFCSLVIGAIGAIWIIFDADLKNLLSFKIGYGESLFLIGCISFALYTILCSKLTLTESNLEQSTITMIFSATLLMLFEHKAILEVQWLTLSLKMWAIILYLSFFATAGAFLIIQYSVKLISGTQVMAYYYLVPMWVLIWDILIIGNNFRLELLLGCIAIISTFIIIYSKELTFKSES